MVHADFADEEVQTPVRTTYFNVLETVLTDMTPMWYNVICDSEVACTCV
jgi:hypothetical protein